MADPKAAHIFPFSTTEKKNFFGLNNMLETFWGADKTQIWASLFQDREVTESPRNLICLNRQLHWLFDRARMAFKPLREDPSGGIVVQFHWLKENGLKPQILLQKSYEDPKFADILERAGLSQNGAWGERLAHRKSGLPLETGQVFILGEKEPKQAPDIELLKLSWDLLRVGAISGAAEPRELDDDDGDDDADNHSAVGYQDWDGSWEWNEEGRWRRREEGVEGGGEGEQESRGRSTGKQPRLEHGCLPEPVGLGVS